MVGLGLSQGSTLCSSTLHVQGQILQKGRVLNSKTIMIMQTEIEMNGSVWRTDDPGWCTDDPGWHTDDPGWYRFRNQENQCEDMMIMLIINRCYNYQMGLNPTAN